MMDLTIWHNPRCSKSRSTLALLHARGLQPRVVEYLKTPPSPEELGLVLQRLGIHPRDLMRKKEPAYAERNLDNEALSPTELIMAMVEAPSLIERPVVIAGERVAIGRPPEAVLEILE